METFYQLLGLLGSGLIIWMIYRTIKNRPDAYSRENIQKSLTTMGILAIILIIFIALLIFSIRN